MRYPLLAFLVLLTGCGGEAPVPAHAPTATDKVSAQFGGTVGTDAKLEIQPGALKVDSTIEIVQTEPDAYSDPSTTIVGPIWNARVNGKEHYTFNYPITIHLPFNPERVPDGWRVGICVWENGRWSRIPNSTSNDLTKTVTVSMNHFSAVASNAYKEGIHVVSRWFGTNTRIHYCGPAEPTPRTMGMTGYTETTIRKWSFREEMHDRLHPTRHNRLVPESASVSFHRTESWILEGQGKKRRALLHPDTEVARSFSEAELNGSIEPKDAEQLRTLEQEIDDAQRKIAQLKSQYPETSGIERDQINFNYTNAKSDLDAKEEQAIGLWFYGNRKIATPILTRSKESVTVGFDLDTTWRIRFKYTRGRADWADAFHNEWYEHHDIVEEPVGINQPAITAPPSGPFIQRISGRDLPPDFRDVDTWTEVHEYLGGDVRGKAGADDKFVTLCGTVAHRIRIPKDDKESNVILAGSNWIQEKTIPAAGTVHVSAWLTESGAKQPPDAPPDVYTRTADDGSFSLSVPLLKDKSILLEAKYVSKEAQLTERQWLTVPVATIKGQNVEEGKKEVPLSDLQRSGVATVRYAMATKDLDLGSETRGGILKRKDGELQLELAKTNSILLSTFVLRAPYLNQNLQHIPLRAIVPIDKLIAVCPPPRLEQTRDRLETDCVPGSSATIVDFKGSVTCKPTCAAMSLGCLDLLNPTGDDVGRIGQMVYDYWAAQDSADDKPPWYFPFPSQTPEWENYRNFVQLNEDAPSDARRTIIASIAVALDVPVFREHWPYVEATNYEEKQWLATLEEPKVRPWQNNDQLFDGLRAKGNFPDLVLIASKEMDVFDKSSDAFVLRALGKGCPGLVGIYQKDEKGKEGKHVLVLLGAIVNVKGEIVRLVFHDPYGDLTRYPDEDGYYDSRMFSDTKTYQNLPPAERRHDKDSNGTTGAYAPYYPPDVRAWNATIKSHYYAPLARKDQVPSPKSIRDRLLPGELISD